VLLWFSPDVSCYAIWLYFRFTPSLGDVEELLAQRGIEISYETIRCWALKLGPLIAANLRQRRSRRLTDLISLRGWFGIRGRRMFLGAPSMKRARCWTCWFSVGATSTRR